MSLENEKLFRLLGEVDENILDEACQIDSADKLQELKYEKHGKSISNKRLKLKVAMRFVAATACMILCVVSLLTALRGVNTNVSPDISANSSQPGGMEIPPQSGGTSGDAVARPDWDDLDYPTITRPKDTLHIEGIDMLNYYSAVSAISETDTSDVPDDGVSAPIVEPDTTSEPDIISEPDTTSSHDEPQIDYCEIEPDTLLGFGRFLFFEIEIVDGGGFLAQKLGTGVVDVVISEDFLWGDDLITFKNGDRYFSCLMDSYHAEYDDSKLLWYSMQFSTHKSIDGFYVVKNFEQANYHFNVYIENDQVMGFECTDWDKGENPDGVLPVVSKTVVVKECQKKFTIAELEDYFNSL